jgi:thiosulfate/3-mercaptopyruvate sulfurtransferase
MHPFTTPLISAPALLALLESGQKPVLLDCGFDLTDPQAGLLAYAAGHLPGATWVSLDDALSGPSTDTSGQALGSGRHPLPDRATLAAAAGAWGIAPDTPVVCYDAQGGPYAARAWWLLRWLGHTRVTVLDGGLAAWQAASGTLSTQAPDRRPVAPYPSQPPAMPTIDADTLLARLGQVRLLDARAPERFRGEVEPLDPVAGHIPGAANRFFKLNLQADGRFRPAAELRAEFEREVSFGTPPALVVHQCGSGVTACHNLLAMAHAGLEGSLLYPGSWSEWCASPARPVARG